MDLKDRIASHFGAEDVHTIEVPEWGEAPDKPLVVHFRKASLKDLNDARRLAEGNLALANVRLVTMKATDAAGKRLFQMADATFLMENADPAVVARIAQAISGDQPTDAAIEAAEGN